MMTFRHAGDLGDIVYSLPVVRAMGGGIFLIEAAAYTRVRLTPDKWCGIDRLLSAQSYIQEVRAYRAGEYMTVNLNEFRQHLNNAMRRREHLNKSLCDWALETHRLPLTTKDSAWLAVDPNPVAKVVINRSGAGRARANCYHNWKFPWHRVWQKYGRDAVFIGTRDEHAMFCATCGDVPHHPTADLLEAARVIAGAKLFIGNQSVCYAIAEGLKQRAILEIWPDGPNCLFFRDGVTHGWDEKITLPEF